MCMIPVFRIIILGNNRMKLKGTRLCRSGSDWFFEAVHAGLRWNAEMPLRQHVRVTPPSLLSRINYYTKSIEISTQPVILKVCSIPYDLLSPTNEYLSVYIKTTHVAVLIADETREDLFEYIFYDLLHCWLVPSCGCVHLEQYLTKIKAISELISDTIPVLVVLKKSNATSLPKKVLKSFFSPFSSVSYYEMNAFSEASVKTVYDKTVQIIAQKIQYFLCSLCHPLGPPWTKPVLYCSVSCATISIPFNGLSFFTFLFSSINYVLWCFICLESFCLCVSVLLYRILPFPFS